MTAILEMWPLFWQSTLRMPVPRFLMLATVFFFFRSITLRNTYGRYLELSGNVSDYKYEW